VIQPDPREKGGVHKGDKGGEKREKRGRGSVITVGGWTPLTITCIPCHVNSHNTPGMGTQGLELTGIYQDHAYNPNKHKMSMNIP